MLEKCKNTMLNWYVLCTSCPSLSDYAGGGAFCVSHGRIIIMTKKEHDDFWTKWKRELTKDVKADRIHGGEADFSRMHGVTLDTQKLYDMLP